MSRKKTRKVNDNHAILEIHFQIIELEEKFWISKKTFNFICRKIYEAWSSALNNPNRKMPTFYYSACVLNFIYNFMEENKQGSVNKFQAAIRKLSEKLSKNDFPYEDYEILFKDKKAKKDSKIVPFVSKDSECLDSPYNFTMVCTRNLYPSFSAGTLYEVKGGAFEDDTGYDYGYFIDVDDVNDEMYFSFGIVGKNIFELATSIDVVAEEVEEH